MPIDEVILPLHRVIYRKLENINNYDYGDKLISLTLSGFAFTMLMKDFSIPNFLYEIDYLDGFTSYEVEEAKKLVQRTILDLVITYRNYFETRKYTMIQIVECYYTERKILFAYKVKR